MFKHCSVSFAVTVDCCIRGKTSVVVAGAADVAVPDRWSFRRRFSCIGLVEPVLEDRGNRAVGGGTNLVAAPAGRFHPGRAVAAHEPENAEASAKALFGMWLGLHDRLDEGDGGRADRGGMTHHPRRRPLCVTPVRTRHVLLNGGVPVVQARAYMAGNPAAFVEDLDRRVGNASLDLLADQARGH